MQEFFGMLRSGPFVFLLIGEECTKKQCILQKIACSAISCGWLMWEIAISKARVMCLCGRVRFIVIMLEGVLMNNHAWKYVRKSYSSWILCLLKGYIIFCGSTLSCAMMPDAELCDDMIYPRSQDEDIADDHRMKRTRKVWCEPVELYLEKNKNKPCFETKLIELFYSTSCHKKRDLCMTIFALRREKLKNIIHNAQEGTVMLCDGVRLIRPDCYKVELWRRFSACREQLDVDDMQLVLELSGQGFNPSISGVSAVKFLKIIMDDIPYEGVIFERRKKIWELIVHEKSVRKLDAYKRDNASVCGDDLATMKQSWGFYVHHLRPEEMRPCATVLPCECALINNQSLEEAPAQKKMRLDGAACSLTSAVQVSASNEECYEEEGILQRRMAIVQYLKRKKGNFCAEDELLARFYEDSCTRNDLLEDVVELIYAGHNLLYTQGCYHLVQKDRGEGLGSRGWELFLKRLQEQPYQELSVVEKTYNLYAEGGYCVPLSTVALYTCVMRSQKQKNFLAKIPSIVKLKEIILK